MVSQGVPRQAKIFAQSHIDLNESALLHVASSWPTVQKHNWGGWVKRGQFLYKRADGNNSAMS
eukprot:3931392-Amphidinium_carterae.1